MSFEERLSTTLVSILGLTVGCAPTLEEMCDGGRAPEEGYAVHQGYVEVEPGTECPPMESALLNSDDCAHTYWQGIVCEPAGKEENMVYMTSMAGGHYTSASNVSPSATRDVVDLCWYEGVYFNDPDPSFICGRPVLHDGAPVVAPVVARPSGWNLAPGAGLANLDPAERERLAAHWLDAAVMEHASVAAFSRMSLDLLRLGAPPELLVATHRAALDEVEHARLCFSLASAYRGIPSSPGPLTLPEAAGSSQADAAEALLREGCVGETLAAVDAATRLAQARDPAVRAALEVVVRDESEHAALAWRTLRWMLAADPSEELRARLSRAVAEEAGRWTREAESVPVSEAEAAHGLLDPRARGVALARAWRDVIAPSWDALLG
ncbi:MAG: ferritin-like domain-containing protein [Alphaproteobacteria bacterium]|nr:ferritin-like domain-containing protein [Alphaproteobacteria bacterium]MCB9696663.1 ferritin-like domain-containing protein [Alphaproteobacteria bacterium]